MTINELFGTLQQAVVGSWREHLKTTKYSTHMALDDLYKELPELVDSLIETWQGTHDLVDNYTNIVPEDEPSTYLSALILKVEEGYGCLEGDKACESILDEISALLKQTLYKLNYLKESEESENQEAADYISLQEHLTNALGASQLEE